MASVVISANFDMHSSTNDSGTEVAADASHIEIDSGALVGDYFGSFTYDSSGNVFGTITSFTESSGGVLELSAAGIDVPANTAEQLVKGKGFLALSQIAFAGDDQFIVQPGTHVIDGYTGFNTVTESEPMSAYTITPGALSFEVNSADTQDTMFNIQQVIFPDGFYDVQSGALVPDSLVQSVQSVYVAVLRAATDNATADAAAVQIASGKQTLTQLETQLIGSAQGTTIPALLSYDFMYGVTPTSGGLSFLTTYAADLQSGNYSFTNGFQLGTTPGEFSLPQFSVLNTYVNFCATAVAGAGNTFAAQFGSLASTVSVANRTAFFTQVYQRIFGVAPAASTVALFCTNPSAADPTISTFQYYVNYAGSELGGYGAVAGVLLWTAETSNLGVYPAAVNSFLSKAATTAVAGGDRAPYGQSLLAAFPGSAPSATVSSATIGIAGDAMRFIAAAGDNTEAGSDQIAPATVGLDFASLPGAANIALNRDVAALPNDVATAGSGALIGFHSGGPAGGGAAAVSLGLTDVNTLVAQRTF